MTEVAVIGIGNLARGDDALGILAARRIREALPEVRVIESSGDITHLLDCFREYSSVYIVDAISFSQEEASSSVGTIHEFDAIQEPLPSAELLTSSHAVGVSQAIELARALNALPKKLRVLGVVGREFEMREGLSDAARLAVVKVAEKIVSEIKKAERSHA